MAEAMVLRGRHATGSLVAAVVGRMVRREAIDRSAVTASSGKGVTGTAVGRGLMMTRIGRAMVLRNLSETN